MDDARFQRLAELFDVARELDRDAREAWIEAACAGDDALRAELEALLAQHDTSISSGRESLLDAGARLRDELSGSLDPAPDAPLPESVGRYRVLGEIARGGFGVVLRGADATFGRDVAIKILLPGRAPDPRIAALLEAEGRICGRLQHPGIVPVYELGRMDDGEPFVVMKVVEGRTLATLLRERGAPDADRPRLLAIFEQVCQALAYAHARGVVHRDLKPQNLMVGAFGEVQVMDWGLAIARDEPRAADGPGRRDVTALGTPAYMAPEQARGEARAADPRCDVFGLGAILCEVLTGAPPFVGDGAITTLRRAKTADLTDAFARIDASGADPELRALARACLAGDPAARPSDARAVADAVRAHLESLAARARDAELAAATARQRADAERTRRRLTTALGAVVVLATLVGAAVWLAVEGAARERQRTADAGLRDALLAAERLAADAAAERPETSTRWAAAATTAANAERLILADVDAALAAQVRALRARADDRLREVRFAERLESIGLEERFLSTYDLRGQLGAYRDAFAGFVGTELDTAPLDEVTGRLARFAFRERLIAALDWWRTHEEQVDPGSRRVLRLRELADAIETDPWRREVRAAAMRRDGDRLAQLADEPRAGEAPAGACVFLAARLIQLQRARDALALLERAVQRFPSDFETVFNLSMVHDALGNNWQAVRHATAARALRPNSALPHTLLAEVLLRVGAAAEAIDEARRAIELAADDFGPGAVAASVLFEAGLVDEAEARVADYRSAPDNHAVFPLLASLLGNIRATQLRFAEAVDAYLDAVRAPLSWEHDPSWRLDIEGVADGIRDELGRRLAAPGRPDADLLYLRARLEEDLGLLGTALERFEALEAVHPGRRFVRAKITALRAQLQGALSSIPAIDDAIGALDPALSPDAARVALFGSRPPDAAATPARGLVEFAEGRLLVRAGRLEDAIPHLVAAVDADREQRVSWRRLHEALVAHRGRAHADAAVRERLAAGPPPRIVLDLAPAPPAVLAPDDGATLDGAITLRVGPFVPVDPRQRHDGTIWQVRDVDADPERGPLLEILGVPDTALAIPPGVLVAGHRYAWRAGFAGDNAPTATSWSAPRTFGVAAGGPRAVPLDLSAILDADVVADTGDATADAFDPLNGYQLVVRGHDGARVDRDDVHGVPADGRVGVHRLGPPTGPNARALHATEDRAVRIECEPTRCAAIRLLGASANGGARIPVVILYADASSERTTWNVPDWFSDARATAIGRSTVLPAWRGMDRSGRDGVEQRDAAALFESVLLCDPARRVVAIELRPDQGGFTGATTTANLLAVTLMAVGDDR